MTEIQRPDSENEQLTFSFENDAADVNPDKNKMTAHDFDITKDPQWHAAVAGLKKARAASRRKQPQ